MSLQRLSGMPVVSPDGSFVAACVHPDNVACHVVCIFDIKTGRSVLEHILKDRSDASPTQMEPSVALCWASSSTHIVVRTYEDSPVKLESLAVLKLV